MTLWEYCLQYTGEILEGKRSCPGITLEAAGDMERAVELFGQVDAMGVETFVRTCAEMDGTEIPPEIYEAFCPEELQQLLARLPDGAGAAPAESRNAYEVLLDCCCLEDGLVAYLMQVLRDGDRPGFYRLSQVTTRTDIRPEAFLSWLATLQDRAGEEERSCAAVMDACFARLLQEGQRELMVALLSGDPGVYEAFRREAQELRERPDWDFSWYERNYLDRDYPIRVLMRANGIAFPGDGR